ncbi:MAG TPA: hypothetical protein VFR17_08980 [Mycobacterium sp.]|nr:hypothetical protein [Mycobacterium sp.]
MTVIIETIPSASASASKSKSEWAGPPGFSGPGTVPFAIRRGHAPQRRPGRTSGRACVAGTGPGRPRSMGPAGAPVRYRGTGVLMSQTAHRRRPITPATTVVLALLAAAITVWLGFVADFGAALSDKSDDASAVPDRLAVVQVHTGESLQHLAARVAPDAPAGRVMDRIRELNRLESVALDAGQTLIAPVG